MSQTQELETASIGRLLLKFSIPAIIGTLVTSLYNVVDRIFLGRYVGEVGIGATAVSFPLMMIMMATGMLIGFGTNSLISIKLGEKKPKEAEELLGQGIFLFCFQGLLLTVFGLIFLEPILRLFGATDTILPTASTYLGIVLIGTIPHEISFGVNNFIRGEGNPRVAMVTMVTGGLINIALDYLFIAKWGWGASGAAYATVIGYSISAIWVLYHYLSGKSVVKFHFSNFTMKWKSVRRVMIMGSPQCTMGFIASIITSIFNNQLAKYGGDTAISVNGVIMSFNSIWIMPVIGVSQGAQPIIGYNHGAKKYDRVKKTLVLAILAITSVSILISIGMFSYPEKVFELFVGQSNPKMTEMGVEGICIFLGLLPVIGYMIMFGNYYQFVGRPKISLFLTVFRQGIVLMPLVIILPNYFGLRGVWFSGLISDIATLIVTVYLTVKEWKLLNQKIAIQLEHQAPCNIANNS